MSTPDLLSLAGKTVVITGAARGIGITLAMGIVEAGGSVACLDVLETPVHTEWIKLQRLASLHGVAATYHHCDVTDEHAVEIVMDAVAANAETLGCPFWGTIACAGIQQTIAALEYPMVDFERILRVNVTGVFNTCKYAARILHRETRAGSIVIIASMSGNIANRGLYCTAYNTSKAAVQQMCRSLAQEWGQYGIRVNSLSPGYIMTPMTDKLLAENPEIEQTWRGGALLGRFGIPEDLKLPAVFLLSEGAAFVHGSDLRVDGGHCASA
ncbi:hypothetical protein E4U17_000061 [Claviceps sp. LM77 group G4]|nr:hypothetical protein E4U17_000061 [Claviceps sp. LM77 group G4]KAG6084493.1 hypothetical protein E4U16_001622 [Claviceps sp. LM84 group G4]KAG6086657.1 hypothetical protein E4U33_002333 [Claviceps sp. LM78 group G4]